MSTIKADTVTAKSDDTDLTITRGGTGVPNLEAGFKVGGSVGVPTASIQDDAVTTAKILNDNVTLAKLASGTDGELITWDASGDPATVGVGTATHVLTSNGAGAAPTFQAAAAGGAWTLIGTAVASNSANLTITGLDTSVYDTFKIEIAGILPATDAVYMNFRMGDSSGIDSGSTDYSWAYDGKHWSGGLNGDNTGDAEIQLNATSHQIGNVDDYGDSFSCSMTLFTSDSTNQYPSIAWATAYKDSENLLTAITGGGERKAIITLTQVQLLASSGNLDEGRMTVWGVKHA